MRSLQLLSLALLLSWPLAAAPAPFAFAPDWQGVDAGSAADLSGLNAVPAGGLGRVTAAADGHLYAAGLRQRFFGVNITSKSTLPSHAQADGVARRLAQLGVNLVRFHLTDTSWGGGSPSLIKYSNGNSLSLDPASLDLFDYLFSQLKARGIYGDINLLTGREFAASDGLPAAINGMGWKDRQIPAIFHPTMIQLQKDFAGALLGHLNPYTGLAYKDDPAVLMVEVLNEQGLFQAWLDGRLDTLPAAFSSVLQAQWDAWLKARYTNQAGLAAAWSLSSPAGAELLANPLFNAGTGPWLLEQAGGAAGAYTVTAEGPAGANSARVQATATGTQDWHLQWRQGGLGLATGTVYTLSFSAKADIPRTLQVVLENNHTPWAGLGFAQTLNLTAAWQTFTFTLQCNAADSDARLLFKPLGNSLATWWFAGFSLAQGGSLGLVAGEDLDTDTIPIFTGADRGTRTPQSLRDYSEFLWDTEQAYYAAMRGHVKTTLASTVLMSGTQVFSSTPNLMAQFDIVDTHNYWLHPDTASNPMRLQNDSMCSAADGGTLGVTSLRRVAGKPFCVSEYGHPFPNAYGAEGFLMIAAQAALQDWDILIPYTYSDGTLAWNSQKLNGPFEADTDPSKTCGMPWAALAFRQAGVRPAQGALAASLGRWGEIQVLPAAAAWTLLDGRQAGFDPRQALQQRCYLVTDGGSTPAAAALPASAPPPAGGPLVSDTGELSLDPASRRWVCKAVTVKALAGRGTGSLIDLGGVGLRLRNGMRDWRAVGIAALDGGSISQTARSLLVSAAGAVQNTGMSWMLYPTTATAWPPPEGASLGFYWPPTQWGNAPTLCEGIEADLVLPFSADRVAYWALDGQGRRGATQTAQDEAGQARVVLAASNQSLWYEVQVLDTPMSPSPSPTGTPTPTATATVTATGTPSATASETSPATATATLTATASASQSPTPTLSPSPSSGPSPTATITAAEAAPAQGATGAVSIAALMALPNPDPTGLRIKLPQGADSIRVKVYSPGYTLALSLAFGPCAPGWATLPFPSNSLDSLANGIYHCRVQAEGGGASATAVTKLLLAR